MQDARGFAWHRAGICVGTFGEDFRNGFVVLLGKAHALFTSFRKSKQYGDRSLTLRAGAANSAPGWAVKEIAPDGNRVGVNVDVIWCEGGSGVAGGAELGQCCHFGFLLKKKFFFPKPSQQ